MAKFKSPRLNIKAIRGNFLEKIKNIQFELSDLRATDTGKSETLEQLAPTTGVLFADALISPASSATAAEPTDSGFTGVAMGGNGWTFDGETWHFVGVNAGTLQAGINTEGKIKAGGGAVTLDEDGMSIEATTTVTTPNSVKFVSGADIVSYLCCISPPTLNKLFITAEGVAGKDTAIFLSAEKYSGMNSQIILQADNNILIVNDGQTILNNGGLDADTIIKGDTTTVVTVDAGLEAVGIGGAAESGKALKVTGAFRTTGASALDGLVTTLAGIDNTNGHVRSFSATINDDTATSFTPTKTSGLVIFGGYDSAAAGTFYGIGFYQATGSPFAQSFTLGSNTVFTTGALAGTTGTDTKFTFSAHTDGKLYFENRRGAARVVYVTLI